MPPVEETMTEPNEHLDEGTIHAWLDGALTPDESARVEAHAGACATCASLVAEARGLIAASSRILSSLDAVPAGVIPGSDSSADQLAALRARRRAASRRWWRDRRFVAAASLVFVAGVGSVIWRATGDQSLSVPVSPVAQESTRVIESATPVTDAAREATAPVVAPAPPARDPKAIARPATADFSSVVVTGVSSDTSAERKTEAKSVLRVPAALATNESRRADSIRGAELIAATGRADKATSADSLARQRAAVSPRLAMEALRTDTLRVAAPPALPRRMAPQAAGNAAEFRLADAVPAVGACYQLQMVQENGRASTAADTVRLLDEIVPERSDPRWRRAQRLNASLTPAVLTWREIESALVELRIVSAVDSTIVRFGSENIVITGRRGEVIVRPAERPNVRGLPGVRAAFATRIACP